MMQPRVALYARVSSKAQAEEDKVSMAEQFAEMEAYCECRGYQVVRRFQDVGSGSTKRRPDFQRMLVDAKEGLFDVILCWKSDRLSRGIYPAAALLELVEAQQIRLESVTDTLDMKTFGIFAAVGKVEIDNFRERAMLGKRGAAKRGRVPIGSLPYGYQIGKDGTPEVNPREGPVVRRIYQLYTSGGEAHGRMGIPSIGQWLKDDNAPMRKGSKWDEWADSQIHRILSAEVYKGTWWYGRYRHMITEDGKKRFSQPKESWIKVPFPPLVDEEMWETAQAIKRDRRNKAKRNTRTFYLLQHLMICGECGMGFAVRSNHRNIKRKNGKTYVYEYEQPVRYYVCNGMLVHGLECREHPYIPAGPIEDLVWSEVRKVLQDPKIILTDLQARTRGQNAEALATEIGVAQRELSAIQAEEDRAIRLHIRGRITEEQFDRQRKFITERLERSRASLESLQAQRRAIEDRQSLAQTLLSWARNVCAGLDALTPEERRDVLNIVVDHVSIGSDGPVHITLAIPVPQSMSDVPQGSSCWWPP